MIEAQQDQVMVDTLVGILDTWEGVTDSLRRAQTMQHDPLSRWEAEGYVVECRYSTRYRSELLYVIGLARRREEAGEDVKLLLHEGQHHAIMMRRGA